MSSNESGGGVRGTGSSIDTSPYFGGSKPISTIVTQPGTPINLDPELLKKMNGMFSGTGFEDLQGGLVYQSGDSIINANTGKDVRDAFRQYNEFKRRFQESDAAYKSLLDAKANQPGRDLTIIGGNNTSLLGG